MRKKLVIALFVVATLLVGFVFVRTPSTTSAHNRAIHPEWPLTVNGAVTSILAQMSDVDKTAVRIKKKSELIQYHFSWSMGIRNSLGLWSGNYSLLTDCHTNDPDDASMVIIEAVWQKLQTQ